MASDFDRCSVCGLAPSDRTFLLPWKDAYEEYWTPRPSVASSPQTFGVCEDCQLVQDLENSTGIPITGIPRERHRKARNLFEAIEQAFSRTETEAREAEERSEELDRQRNEILELGDGDYKRGIAEYARRALVDIDFSEIHLADVTDFEWGNYPFTGKNPFKGKKGSGAVIAIVKNNCKVEISKVPHWRFHGPTESKVAGSTLKLTGLMKQALDRPTTPYLKLANGKWLKASYFRQLNFPSLRRWRIGMR